MRILHVVPTYLPATRYGGPIRSVHGLCKALVGRGHEVHVFTTSVDGPGDSQVPHGKPVDLDGVKVWYFASRFLRRLYWSPKMGRALACQVGNFDLVHLHSVFLWPTWKAARTCRQAGVPYLLAPRGMLVKDLVRSKSRWLKSAWLWLIERHNLAAAARVHVTAPVELEEMQRFGFKLPRTLVLPNGIEPDQMVPAEQSIHDRPYALFLGRINWKKGIDLLIEAWPQVESLDLVIVGNDEEGLRTILERRASERSIADRVFFLGPVLGPAKWRLYQDATLFLLPSQSENFGIAVLEAMAMGCPVVVSENVGIAPAVRKYQCGKIVERQADEISGAVNRLSADADRLAEMGRKGAQAARDHYSWPPIAARCEEEYQAILQAGESVSVQAQDHPV